MRQAFTIRLSQLERRYQRQLLIEQQRNAVAVANGAGGESAIPINVQLRARHRVHHASYKRRSSWHNCLSDSDTDEPAPMPIQRSGSSQGFDSDCCSEEESDVELTLAHKSDDEALSRDHRHRTGGGGGNSNGGGSGGKMMKPLDRSHSLSVASHPLGGSGGGLKGGARLSKERGGNHASPRLSPVRDTMERNGTLSPEAKVLIQQRVGEHRSKILRYFQQVSLIHCHAVLQGF